MNNEIRPWFDDEYEPELDDDDIVLAYYGRYTGLYSVDEAVDREGHCLLSR